MRGLSAIRTVAAACLGAALLWAPPALADANDGAVVGRDDIARQLGFARTRAIRPTAAPSSATPPRMQLSAIRFEFNSDRLTARARTQVAELAAALKLPALQGFSFAVVGHTDSVGSQDYNRALSLRRALSVKRELLADAVEAGRLVELGLGEDYPVAGTAGDDDRNRRVEIVNLGTGAVVADAVEAPSPAAARDEGRRTGRALVIGIDRYRHVSPLIGTVNDARAMKAWMSSHLAFGDGDIRMLLDGEATRENILRSIEDWLIAGTRPGDDVFLYYSGHGYQQRDENDDEADRLDETLVPVDVTIGPDGAPRGMIADDEVAALMARLAGRRVHVVIDACHSGTGDRLAVADAGSWRYVKTPRGPDGAPLRIGGTRTRAVPTGNDGQEAFVSTKDAGVSGLDITVWAAVRADQKALVDEETPDQPGSVFTRRLLWGARDGRADADANGIVTRSELHAWLVRESGAYCERHPHRCGRGLTPQLHAESGGPERAAFSRGPASALARPAASVAKDILVRRAERLTAAASERGLRLDIEPGATLPVGSSVDIVVESDRDGRLVLLDIDPAGRMVQIFPNRFSDRGGIPDRIRAGQPLRVPGKDGGFRFSVEPPPGAGTLMALVVEEGLPLAGLVSRHKDLAVIERPDAYLVELNEALRAMDGGEWGRATREYEVVARQ